jgi:hypothetical protein
MRVGLAVGEAGKAVEAVAAHAAPALRVGLVEIHADRQVERLVAGTREVVVELLDARLVRHGRVGEGSGAGRLGRVLARPAVHEVQPLGFRVVRLEVRVGERPRRGDAAVVADLLEVALAQPEEDRAVDLRIAADEVLRVRLERRAGRVIPGLAGHVAVAVEDLVRIPVLGLAREVAAALQQQEPLAGRREAVRQRAPARSRPDDDHVVVLAHVHRPPGSDEGDR